MPSNTMLPPAELVGRFEDRTLPRSSWTHEAHLVVCWAAVRNYRRDAALRYLRTSIVRYNEAVNVPNTDTGGYHETLTRYYLDATADAMLTLDAALPNALFTYVHCMRNAPSEFWSRASLFSLTARRAWVGPDRRALPWA